MPAHGAKRQANVPGGIWCQPRVNPGAPIFERGRDPEALAQAHLLLHALRFMRADREWQELLRALRQALQQQAVGLALMRQVKAYLRHMVAERYDP